MSYVDAVARISQIQSQFGAVRTAFTPAPPTAATGASGASSASGTAPTSFQSALATAQGTASAPGAAGPVDAATIPGAVSGGAGVAALPASAGRLLTSAQQTFAARLAADTGLDPRVVTAWVLSEESGGAAVSRQSAGNNDWLNIGYTDSGTYGASASVWSDPAAAADATAGWLHGQDTIPGYGRASAGIQAILGTVGQGAASQIAAIQHSGWASSGYPSLPGLYGQLA